MRFSQRWDSTVVRNVQSRYGPLRPNEPSTVPALLIRSLDRMYRPQLSAKRLVPSPVRRSRVYFTF